jgi:SAM-dependent methyltransferase
MTTSATAAAAAAAATIPVTAAAATSPVTAGPASSLQCPQCKKTAEKLQQCSQCHFEKYCGKECQTAHWPQHKPVCFMIKQTTRDWETRNPGNVPSEYWKIYIRNLPTPLISNFSASLEKEQLAIDIGSGTGPTTMYLLQRNWKVIATDFYQEPLNTLQSAAKKTNARWLSEGKLTTWKGDIVDYPFPKDTALIVAADVLPYLHPKKLGSVLDKIYDSLQPGGQFLGSFFQHGCTSAIYGGWTLPNMDTIKALLAQKSFQVDPCQYRQKIGGSLVIEFIARKK